MTHTRQKALHLTPSRDMTQLLGHPTRTRLLGPDHNSRVINSRAPRSDVHRSRRAGPNGPRPRCRIGQQRRRCVSMRATERLRAWERLEVARCTGPLLVALDRARAWGASSCLGPSYSITPTRLCLLIKAHSICHSGTAKCMVAISPADNKPR